MIHQGQDRQVRGYHKPSPQLLGIQIPDNVPPVISSMYVYRLNGKPFNEFTPKQYFQVAGANGKYTLNKVNTINLAGEVGLVLLLQINATAVILG